MKSRVNLNIALVASGSLLATVLLTSACGSPDNTNIPEKPQDLTTSDVSDPGQLRWSALASALGIPANNASSPEALPTQLATPPAFTTKTNPADLQSLTTWSTRITQAYLPTQPGTRCASIESMVELQNAVTLNPTTGAPEDFPGAKVYQLKYKLQNNADGKPENGTRTGLVVVPTTKVGSGAPIVAYGHGGKSGLGYLEIAGLFGPLQARHIIVAPTYPGEPLCKQRVDTSKRPVVCDAAGVLAPATGTQDIYVNDVDELLGMHDCVARATLPSQVAPLYVAAKNQEGQADDAINGILRSVAWTRTHGAGLPQTPSNLAFPVSFVMGSSRGGQVARLALAKTGAALSALNAVGGDSTKVYRNSLPPSFFSCAGTLFPPATLAMTELRLALEQMARGTFQFSPFSQLPTLSNVNARFADYLKITSANPAAYTSAASAQALEVAQSDALYTSGLVAAALRKWGSAAPSSQGAWLNIHGLSDKLVPVSQSRAASAIFYNVQKAATAAGTTAGVDLTSLGLKATDADAKDPTLSASPLFQHGDAAFRRSTATTDLVTNQAIGSATALPITTPYNGLTVDKIFGGWLNAEGTTPIPSSCNLSLTL